MKILHVSDLHGNTKPLRKIVKSGEGFDTIVLTGDIPPTHIAYMIEGKDGRRIIDRAKEGTHQAKWCLNELKPLLDKIPHKHLIILNGNHCFCYYDTVFPNAITQFSKSRTVEIDGIKFGLAVGIPPLDFEWHEELPEYDFNELLLFLDPAIQVLVTHAPPSQILDRNYGGQSIGYNCLYKHIFGLNMAGIEPTFKNLKAHLFGHAHESTGIQAIELDGRQVCFSNAACTTQIIDNL